MTTLFRAPAVSPLHLCPASLFSFHVLQDSGGPLWAVDTSRNSTGFVQYGLVSSAIGSKRYPCDSSWPTVFMRTSYYMDWIDDTIGKKYKLL